MRNFRQRRKLRRSTVALAANFSTSLLDRYESGLIPPAERLDAWSDACGAPSWLREKLRELTDSARHPRGKEIWPPVADPEDYCHIEDFRGPASYQLLPTFDLIYANSAFHTLLPGLDTMVSPTGDPVNLLEWHLLHPSARRAIKNWDQRTHVMLTRFRVFAPGLVPQRRIDELIAAFSDAHEFERMWTTEPSEADYADPRITLLEPTPYEHPGYEYVDYHARMFRLDRPGGRLFNLFHLARDHAPFASRAA
ncbi:MmyB family transcriptional regulator [Nocardia sp. NPDC003963]